MDENLVKWFKGSNNRVKSAVCRYILKELGIDVERFNDLLTDWEEWDVKELENGFYEIIINPKDIIF